VCSTAIPLLTLGVLKVKSVSCYKYFEIVLDIELSDDKDIQRQILYCVTLTNFSPAITITMSLTFLNFRIA